MSERILTKDQISKLYEELSKDYSFYAPTKVKGNISFSKISNPDDIELNYLNSKIPPKEILFPRMETIFEYKTVGKEIEIEPSQKLDEKRIIFGIRPCDAYSFKILENFFGFGQYKDDLYLKKQENSVLIGIGCNAPRQTCFCTSLEGHPHKKEDVDVFLTDIDEKYVVYPITEKGKTIINEMTWLSNASDADLKRANELSEKAENSFSTNINFKNTADILDSNFNHPIWEEISENCLGCGTCAFLCPTCHCFDVVDENDHYNNKGRRVRLWDTCQFCIYTLHTSGHNPRDSKIQRCRNRILHKFSYYPKNYDLIGCVGCGRCVSLCPVNNDLREIIDKVNNIEKKNKEEEIVAT